MSIQNQCQSHSVSRAQHWIHSNQLKPGMYVSELDVAWEKTDFMLQGFIVHTMEDVQSVQRQARYVRVLSQKVCTTDPSQYKRMCGAVGRFSGL